MSRESKVVIRLTGPPRFHHKSQETRLSSFTKIQVPGFNMGHHSDENEPDNGESPKNKG